MKPSPKPQAAQVFFSNITKNITEHEIFFNKLPDTDGNHKNLAWIFRYLLIETVSHFVIVGTAVFHLVYGLWVSSTLLLQPVSELLVRLWMCGNVKYGGGWWSLCWGRRKDVGILAPGAKICILRLTFTFEISHLLGSVLFRKSRVKAADSTATH